MIKRIYPLLYGIYTALAKNKILHFVEFHSHFLSTQKIWQSVGRSNTTGIKMVIIIVDDYS